jgi:cytoskeletal protein CcmA (bactofilin family)
VHEASVEAVVDASMSTIEGAVAGSMITVRVVVEVRPLWSESFA